MPPYSGLEQIGQRRSNSTLKQCSSGHTRDVVIEDTPDPSRDRSGIVELAQLIMWNISMVMEARISTLMAAVDTDHTSAKSPFSIRKNRSRGPTGLPTRHAVNVNSATVSHTSKTRRPQTSELHIRCQTTSEHVRHSPGACRGDNIPTIGSSSWQPKICWERTQPGPRHI